MKFICSGLLGSQKMRVGAAGFDKSLKCVRTGKLDAEMLHRATTFPRCAANVVSVEVGKEMELVIRCLFVAEDEP